MPAKADRGYEPRADLLAGRVILVTGAGDGIGRAAALAYAGHGADVVLLGRTEAKLEAVFDIIEAGTETRPVVVPADLEHASEDAATILYHAIRREYGRLDGILHNAGLLGPRTSIAEYPVADWLEVMHVNVNAAFIVTRALMPLLRESKDASVVFTSSGVGRRGRAEWGAVCRLQVRGRGTRGGTRRRDGGDRPHPGQFPEPGRDENRDARGRLSR